jgi:poly(A) polymerase
MPAGPLPQDLHAVATACDAVLSRQLRRITVPKRFTLPMRDIVLMQPRFENRVGRRALRLLGHPRFRAAYDFLLLRAASGEIDPELAAWWTRLQELPEAEQVTQVENRPVGDDGEAGPRRIRSRRRRRRRAAPA